MLIRSARHTAEDLARWEIHEQQAEVHSNLTSFKRHLQRAETALLSFAGNRRAFAGVSWGKDSTVLAHLIARLTPNVPLVWVRVEPDYNPDCPLVRDAFLSANPGVNYYEIAVKRDATAQYVAHGTLEAGMKIARKRFGDAHISGVRADESKVRMRRMATWGESSPGTCAPIGWWSAWDVYAYLVSRRLPIHPAYACTMNGLLDPIGLRVSPLGGKCGERPGDNFGRKEWEERYYGQHLARLRIDARRAPEQLSLGQEMERDGEA